MMVFMDTTATIPTGAMAERWAWRNFVIYGLWVALPYCLYANWVWGGGWLAQMGINWGLGHGAVDFAGSGVVHAMGGFIGLAGAIVVGPRIGKFKKDGTPKDGTVRKNSARPQEDCISFDAGGAGAALKRGTVTVVSPTSSNRTMWALKT